ncbi:MAG: Na+/H+ antiporter NhaA [Jiangellaceae bacterium]
MPVKRIGRALFGRLPSTERTEVLAALRDETAGGFVLLAAAAGALLWANLGGDSYRSVANAVFGPSALHLDLSVATWAADGLLAVFFLVAGLELKREIVLGELSNSANAVLPVAAAICGVAFPALVYVVVNVVVDGGDLGGWAVPTATDIAFALAVLAVIGSRLPTSLRAFLLTLAVVDDLLAITIIAVFFTPSLSVASLLGALALLGAYALLQRLRVGAWWVYVPLGLAAWVLVHESGVHATVVGIAFGLFTRARRDPGEHESPAERLEHRLRPLSAMLCVPVFALMAAGVTVSGDALRAVFTEPVALGIVFGLLVGKAVGILGGSYLTARFTRAELSDDLAWSDVFGVAVLAGIGFTVSLLICELAFADGATVELAKTAVLVGSLLAAVVASVLLARRNAVYRRIDEEDSRDSDHDGTPDVYQHGQAELED